MAVLLLIDHGDGRILSASRSALAAARRLGPVHALVAGRNLGPVAASAARLDGVERVLVADDERFDHALAEHTAALLRSLAAGDAYSHVVAAANATGKNVLPRAAALLDVQPIGDVVAVHDADTFVRPIYAGNALATVRSADRVKLLTVRAAAFDPVGEEARDGDPAPIEPVPPEPVSPGSGPTEGDAAPRSRFVGAELSQSERPDLAAARVVVAGGRGLGSGENFRLLDPLADVLGAAIGASRAAVDSGFIPNDHQVGQTGKIVAPELYLAVGISGAIQHLAGMKDSKVIVAINKDPEAPIFGVADYGLVADLFTAVPALEAELRKA